MPLQTLEPQRLYRQIAAQLRELMAAGEFKPGMRLPAERDLARQLGVSRPSVREALIALEVENWVEVRTGSGVYVLARRQPSATATANDAEPPPSVEWGPLELIRARRLIEGEIAALAAGQAKRRQLAAMGDALAAMQAQAEAGQLPVDGDRAFHTAIAEAAGNAVLVDTVQRYWDARRGPMFERLTGHFETLASWRAAIGEHQVILAAIQARDGEAARKAMHAHLDQSHKRFSASWRRAQAASDAVRAEGNTTNTATGNAAPTAVKSATGQPEPVQGNAAGSARPAGATP